MGLLVDREGIASEKGDGKGEGDPDQGWVQWEDTAS